MTQRNPKPKPDFELTISLSPRLKKFISTATEASRVVIKVGKLAVPLLIAGSTALQHFAPDRPHIPQQPDSIELHFKPNVAIDRY
jgi:hypothetical protein